MELAAVCPSPFPYLCQTLLFLLAAFYRRNPTLWYLFEETRKNAVHPSDGGLYCPPDARSMCGYAGRHPTDDPPMSVTYLVHTGSSRSDIGRLLSNVWRDIGRISAPVRLKIFFLWSYIHRPVTARSPAGYRTILKGCVKDMWPIMKIHRTSVKF